MNRPTFDEIYMKIAEIIALRNTCPRAVAGVVITIDNRVVSMGYVGSPPGLPHCMDVGCDLDRDGGCLRTLHAENNAISNAAKFGVPLNGATLYTTHAPCLACAKMIVSAGIKKVIFKNTYRDKSGIEYLKYAGIKAIQFHDSSD